MALVRCLRDFHRVVIVDIKREERGERARGGEGTRKEREKED